MKTREIVAVLAVALSACGERPTSITQFTPVKPDAGALKLSAQGYDARMKAKVRWAEGFRSISASIANPPYDLDPLFLLQVNDLGSNPQNMVGWSTSKHIRRGELVEWKVGELPCGRPLEAELYASNNGPVPNDKISGGYLLAYHQLETPACTSPGPRTTPTPRPSPSPSPSPTPCAQTASTPCPQE
jgi:hypothetical protein